MNKQIIISANGGYERQVEINKLFTGIVELNKDDIDILNSCTTEALEEIGLIGCILKKIYK